MKKISLKINLEKVSLGKKKMKQQISMRPSD